MSTKRLFHYTAMVHLASVMKKGIQEGELPVSLDEFRTYEDCPKAVNLTTNEDRQAQVSIWAHSNPADKTRIRLTVEVEESSVFNFRKLREMYHIPERDLKVLAPYEERKHWWYHKGVIPPSSIVLVEMFQKDRYVTLTGDKLTQALADIETEFNRAFTELTETTGRLKGARRIVMDKAKESWLLDLVFDGVPFLNADL